MVTDVLSALDASPAGVLVVTGAPGTGKSTVALGLVRDRVRGGLPLGAVLVLAPSRVQAGRMRAELGTAVGGTHTDPLVRTPSSLAFAVLRHAAALHDTPEPRLLTGAEQDAVLRELLQGHALGEAPAPDWPEDVRGALATTGFRTQLRDLLMRAVEHGVDPGELTRLAAEHDRPQWRAAAQVMAEYDDVTALSSPGAFDPAWICAAAADLMEGDEDLWERAVGDLRLVVVDDAQELSASAVRLLRAVHRAGTEVVLLGDGDAVVQGFRGAAPERFLDLARELAARRGGAAPQHVVLRRSHRQPGPLAEVTGRVAAQIGVSTGGAHRRPTPRPGHGEVRAVTLHTGAQEAAYVAQDLRRAHLMDGVPWSRMAVIARSGAAHEAVRRALQGAGVPARPGRSGLPVRQDPATRPLLLAYATALDVARWDGPAEQRGPGLSGPEQSGPEQSGPQQSGPEQSGAGHPGADRPPLSGERAMELLTSTIGRADPVAVRRARRALRRHAPGGSPSPDLPLPDLLVAAVLDPSWWQDPLVRQEPDLAPVLRVATAVARGRESVLAGGDAHEVLWAIWSATGLAPLWERQAVAGGAVGARADRHLDAVMVLFGAAEDYVGRLRRRGARGFLTHVAAQEVAPDSLVARSSQEEAVDVRTPFSAAGREWDVVAVIGVQEGVWPDLRLRDSLLGAQSLVEVVHGRPVEGSAGVRAAHRQVLADELRQFHVAVSRARTRLLVTAVASTDEQPSMFLGMVDPEVGSAPPVEVPVAPTLRSWVAQLRRELVQAHQDGDRVTREACADLLTVLAREGAVPGAAPEQWWDAREVSTTRPRVPEGQVPVSPSKVETFTDCGLRWLLTSHGGDTWGAVSSELGTLVHAVVAEAPEAPADQLLVLLEQRWDQLRLPPSWVSDRYRLRARQMIESYVTYRRGAAAAGRSLVAVEVSGQADVGRARIRGQVDRLERDADGAFVVIDLKTGSTSPRVVDMPQHPQLGVYQVAVEEGALAEVTGPGARTGGAGLAHIGRAATRDAAPRWQPPLGSQEDPRWAHELVERTAEGMAGSVFPARPGEVCRTCPVTLSCPAVPEGDHA